MEISSAHHQQMMSSHQLGLEEVIGGCPKAQEQELQEEQEEQEKKKPRPHPHPHPHPEQALRCPRCDSSNTKFCYYNNYSLTQPRYFCKGCRRYWTQGGSLRNVPVGGGCRKNKRSSSFSSSSKRLHQDHQTLITSTTAPNSLYPTLPPLSFDPVDLTLAFASLQDDPFMLGCHNPNPNPNAHAGSGFLDILRYGFLDTTTTSVANPSAAFHNLYGFGGSSSVEEVSDGNRMMVPFDGSLSGGLSAPASAAGSGRGSPCRGMDGGEERVMMGMQWQMSGGGDGGMGQVEAGRDYWNGVGSCDWQHGLINSSLM